MVKIFIDPGHGGLDSGATGNGLQEKDLTLKIATALEDILLNEYQGVTVMMSRTGDQTVSLTERTDAANNWGADYYLAIHINAGGGTGFESYIYPGSVPPITTYQDIIHAEVLKVVYFANRGKKTANFHVLRESHMPALLTENGFIDHPVDAAKLKLDSFLTTIARGHANGLVKAFNLTKKVIVLYHVQLGAFSNKANADNLASRAKSKGFGAIVVLRDSLYKVQMGAFASKPNADALAAKVKTDGFAAFVVKE